MSIVVSRWNWHGVAATLHDIGQLIGEVWRRARTCCQRKNSATDVVCDHFWKRAEACGCPGAPHSCIMLARLIMRHG